MAVTFVLPSQIPKRKQACSESQSFNLLTKAQTAILSCHGMELGKPDKLIGQCQYRTAQRFLGFFAFWLITVPRKHALGACFQTSFLNVSGFLLESAKPPW